MRHETLLLEIGTEELPPKSLLALKTAFAENLKKALDARQFNYSDVAALRNTSSTCGDRNGLRRRST